MAVSTDTIQTLLRQRQDLREALLELRKEIETLDASSLNLVNKNIKTAPPATAATPAGEAAPAGSVPAKAASPETTSTSTPAPKPPTVEAAPASTPAMQPIATAAPEETEPVLTPPAAPAKPEIKEKQKPEPAPAPEQKQEENSKQAEVPEKEEKPKKEEVKAPAVLSVPSKEPEAAVDHNDLSELLEKARGLSDYLLDHPSNLPAAELGALDTAITVSEAATTPAEKTACYHTLQAAYRKISSGTFAASGVSGTTLQDSAAGAPLLWTIPFTLSILILILFPLLLLARHLVGEMFTDDFAADLTWSFGLTAAFLWGVVGTLTLLTLNIARAVYRRRFDGGVQRSPGLRGTLGGLVGGIFFMIVEIWLPMSDATADFALDAIAFAGGMLSAILFAALQRMINAVTGWIEPPKK
ncbi:hypothetical protein [Sneathiella sp.]|uniref:hypothetical protein n=1 Tax=Sneathiella sp. TaxID=1964365 RepID=UPI002621DBF8|nr:hypothetical protein [Sneathiella sp.]MDF2368097.1 hypothetical protein [Sneathiella sp.]